MNKKSFSLDQTTIKKLLTTYNLKIPEFQRSFVWKNEKKKQLLESLFKGFPIGAITLYEDDDEFYYIIDGLQRINTLNQYLSHPSEIISFKDYYNEIKRDLKDLFVKHKINVGEKVFRKMIKLWYENLDVLYEFEKLSILYKYIQEHEKVSNEFKELELVEELQSVLIKNILISDEDIAIIVYSGDKDDLPELFKNINTGSVGLSQYEILQSVWNDYYLDANILNDTFEGFKRELDLIKKDYEINAVKEQGEFDIFKNLIGLNNMICCISNCNKLFTTFKKLSKPIKFEGDTKYYENDNVSFEILSTVLYHTSNKVVKAVDDIFSKKHEIEDISLFIQKFNGIIISAIEEAIIVISKSKYNISNSKYHALYIVAGIIFSKYNIDLNSLTISDMKLNDELYKKSVDLKIQSDEKWFIDKNRQIGFFNKEIQSLVDMKL